MSLLRHLRARWLRHRSPPSAPRLAPTPLLPACPSLTQPTTDRVWIAWHNYRRGNPTGDWNQFLAALTFHHDSLVRDVADLQAKFNQAINVKPFQL